MSDITSKVLASRAIDIARPEAKDYAKDVRFVSTNAELDKALKELSAGKGGVIELAAGGTFRLSATDYRDTQQDAPVLIRSANPDKPAIFSSVTITDRENISIVDVEIYGTRAQLGDSTNMVYVGNSENIRIFDSEIHSNATMAAGLKTMPGADQTVGSSAVYVRGSPDFVFAGNRIYDANHGVALIDTSDVTIVGNEITRMQGDGIRIAGVQDAVIQANWIHDMLGSTTSFNHPDMIQFWGANIRQNTVNVTIRDNVLDVGDGPSYQMIFGRNEDFKQNGWLFDNIQILNNVLVGGTYHQISIAQTQNAVARNNTIFTQEGAYSIQSDGSHTSHGTGWIKLESKSSTIEKNIALTVHGGGDNATYTMGNGRGKTDQNANFVNLEAGSGGDLRDLMLRLDSIWNGKYGSDILWNDGKNPFLLAVADVSVSTYDKSVVRLDASASQNASGLMTDANAKFLWTFDDGTKATGRVVEHDFKTGGSHGYSLKVTNSSGRTDEIARSIDLDHRTGFDFKVSGGKLVNKVDPSTSLFGNPVVSKTGLVISNKQTTTMSRDVEGLTSLDAFDFGMTIAPKAGSAGVFFYIHNAVRGEVTKDGAILYSFTTDKGTFAAQTKAKIFADGAHHVNFVYDGAAGKFGIYVDGALSTQIDATGTTLPLSAWPVSFGRTWGGTIDATLSNIRFSQEAASSLEVKSNFAKVASGQDIPQVSASDKPAPGSGPIMKDGPADADEDRGAASGSATGSVAADASSGNTGGSSAGTGGGSSTPKVEATPHDSGKLHASTSFDGKLTDGFKLTKGSLTKHKDGDTVLNLKDGKVLLDRKNDWLYEAESFDISFEATLKQAASSGTLLHLYKTMELKLGADGSLEFTLTTDAGTRKIVTEKSAVTIGKAQDVSVGYDAEAGIMQIAVDGNILVQGEQTGETPPLKYWGLALGHTWAGKVPNLEIDNFAAREKPDLGKTAPADTSAAATPRDVLLDLDFNGDVFNEVVDGAAAKVTRGDPGFVTADGREAAVFDGNDTVSVSRSTDWLYNRDSFDFDVSLRSTGSGTSTVAQIHNSMKLSIQGDDFIFYMDTDGGRKTVRSDSDILKDGKFHTVGVGYDADEGLLALRVDGKVVDKVAAHGLTEDREYWGLDIGSPWAGSLRQTWTTSGSTTPRTGNCRCRGLLPESKRKNPAGRPATQLAGRCPDLHRPVTAARSDPPATHPCSGTDRGLAGSILRRPDIRRRGLDGGRLPTFSDAAIQTCPTTARQDIAQRCPGKVRASHGASLGPRAEPGR